MTMISSMKAAVKGIRRRGRIRRDHAYLMSADDHILRDIGVRRGDLGIRIRDGQYGV
jgi:uncharacterized protein YjiS (DUF1127 family)